MTLSSPQHYRLHARDVLIHELGQFAADRDFHGKPGRAAGAREAIAELKAGAKAVYFERLHRVVGSADRYSLYVGTKDEVIAELDVLGVGYLHQGNEMLARHASTAIYAIRKDGKTWVRVGNAAYQVAERVFTGARDEVLKALTAEGMAAARTHRSEEDGAIYSARDAIRAGAQWAYVCGTRYDIVTEVE